MSAQIIDKLPLLQNLVKRDPIAYSDEFRLQLRAFEAELAMLKMNPDRDSEGFRELLTFLCHVSTCYPEDTEHLCDLCLDLLKEHADALHPEVRKTIVHCLGLLRSKGRAPALPVLRQLFALFRVQDRSLRDLVFAAIVMDIKGLHIKGGEEAAATSRSLQGYLFSLVSDRGSPTLARRSLDVLVQLYRRRVWTGGRVVNAIGQGCYSRAPRVLGAAVRFFLGREDEDEEDEEDEETSSDPVKGAGIGAVIRRVNQQLPSAHTRATRKRARKASTLANRVRLARSREERRADGGAWDPARVRWPAIELLHDPQKLAESLLATVRRLQTGGGGKLELRLLCLDLCTRLVGHHRLIVLPLYSYLARFMSPYTVAVTRILGDLVQACHELVPPAELAPLLRSVADGFVSEGSANEAMQVGLNTTREVLLRVPLAAKEEGVRDLMSDLAGYKRHRDNGVVAAAKSLIHVLQEVAPEVLRKRDRGRPDAPGRHDEDGDGERLGQREYGATRVLRTVEGIELLERMGLLGETAEAGASSGAAKPKGKGGKPAADDEDDVDSDAEIDPEDLDEDFKRRFRMAMGIPEEDDEEDDEDEEAAAGGEDEAEDDDDDDDDEEDEEDEGEEEEEQGAGAAAAASSAAAAPAGSPASRTRARKRRAEEDEEADEEAKPSPAAAEGAARARRQRAADGKPVFAGKAAAASETSNTEAEDDEEDEEEEEDAKRSSAVTTRILTQLDYDRIRQLKALALLYSGKLAGGGSSRSRRSQLERLRRAAEGLDELSRAATVDFDPTELEGEKARKRRSALMRAEEDEAAKLERKSRGGAKEREGGSTNTEKSRGKNFGMLSKSRAVQSKLKMSLREQHKKIRKHIKNMAIKTGGPLKRRRK
ncbi:hypothetical protein FNF31_07041 [Cafeteria roenbergensis]|uniref:Protein SDA1 n=1 Tax=Cafeteria roenbergensis TaxID=33653 RepID=A0A5A8CBB3_CAFRO|nr:hypothetical protein FNF31_07041 [Cafeteria roenbergensis]